ncbi:MAG: ABC transporter ATP-binding protein/permease [Ilumatobacteraceae bacterium]|jgi:ATP-binding cassette, subfamily B, multidrug efflux pump|nr:ABC transporter ATP-binding protein/permease [Ilumatobacteraceae bacterium]MDP5069104.1 ABC transporter ATP-binding protein/permease [Ilumatobacteraceae bacterium]
MLKRLLTTVLAKYKGLLWVVVIFQAIQAVAGLYLPTLNSDIINNGIVKEDLGYIWRIGGLMLVVTILQVGFSVIAVYFGSKVAMGFGRDVRRSLFHQVNDFSAREVAQFGAPSLITRITNDVQQVQMLVLMTCTLLLSAPFTSIGGVILAMQQDLGLSRILMFSIPILAVLLGLIIGSMVPSFRKMQERIDRINEILREQLTGIRIVRAFVREPEEKKRFSDANAAVTEVALRGGRLQALMFPTATLIINISSVAVVWFGSDRINAGLMQPGAMIAFLTYLTQILMSVMMATWMAALIPRASVSAERIQEVLNTPTSVVVSENAITELQQTAVLQFDSVGFHYPGAELPVLDKVSFTVRAGQTLAVIGSTGSGKTTLVSLIPRLFDATSGVVSLDGVDVRDLAPEALWSRVGIVPQKPYLFSGTVASNLGYGKEDATEEEMWAALRTAQAEDFVRAMPGGLDAVIAQGGSNVSGGQRQRLAIARALIRHPEIYLFDDSFSALDLATDARLREALAPSVRDAVVVIVAQRVSTIRDADQILVLEDGACVGLGTHDELLATCPTFQEIVESQAAVNEGVA